MNEVNDGSRSSAAGGIRQVRDVRRQWWYAMLAETGQNVSEKSTARTWCAQGGGAIQVAQFTRSLGAAARGMRAWVGRWLLGIWSLGNFGSNDASDYRMFTQPKQKPGNTEG